MGQYDNILKAIQQGQKQKQPEPARQLTPDEKSRNYQLFDEIMKKGISLDEVLKAAEGKKDSTGINTEVFSVMEEAVKEDETVAASRKKASGIKAQIITEICMRDDRYRTALEEYRKAVSEAYVRKKETPQEIKSEEPIEG